MYVYFFPLFLVVLNGGGDVMENTASPAGNTLV